MPRRAPLFFLCAAVLAPSAGHAATAALAPRRPPTAFAVNHAPRAIDRAPSSRPTRQLPFHELTEAAARASRFTARALRGAVKVVASRPLVPQVGGPLLDERVQNVTIDTADGRRHLINQDLLYRVPRGAARAFKRGFFAQARGVGARLKVIAVERGGAWQHGAGEAAWAPGATRFIVEASGAQIGTDLPGVAPATAYLMVDTRSLVENEHEVSFSVQFLNPWGQDGLFPPYVDAVGRYGIRDHRDGTATVFAYWAGNAGKELLEPTIRETKVGKTLKAGWDASTRLAGGVPVLGPFARIAARLTEHAALAVGKTATALGDAALQASGATEALFPVAALQHVRFYERDWTSPTRWGQAHAEAEGRGEVELQPAPARPRALPVEGDEAYAQRAWRALQADPSTR